MKKPNMPRWLRGLTPRNQDVLIALSFVVMGMTMAVFTVLALVGFTR